MKFTVFICFLFLFTSFKIFSQPSTSVQNVFIIKELGIKYTEVELIEVLENVDYCGMINPSENYLILLDDGAVIEVLSFQNLKLNYKHIPFDCVRFENLIDDSKWKILEGILMRMVESKSVKK